MYDEDSEEDDGGAEEGPSFESSMRAKYPVLEPKSANMPHWTSTFNDRRKTGRPEAHLTNWRRSK
jgi:hypothetical protein